MLSFSILIGNSITMDVIGICVGHCYYFLEFVYPVVADIRGWKTKRIMEPPMPLQWLCGTAPDELHVAHQQEVVPDIND